MGEPQQPHPKDMADLLEPDLADALLTAGTLIHFVASHPEVLHQFRVWAEHCPGDLEDAEVLAVLAATHDVLSPGCPDPVGWE
jgi:hypothetical protein